MKILTLFVESTGAALIEMVEVLGHFTSYSSRFFYWLPKKPFRLGLIMDQLFFIGNKSLFIVTLTASFAGMVMCYQTYFGFQLISADSFVGPIVALSLAKELAPVFTGLIVTGRAGAAMAAKLGTMKVTEQVDALEVMGISPFQYLALPRIIAGSLALPMLSIIFLFVGSIGAWFIGTKVLMIEETLFFSKLSSFMVVEDIYQGVIKAFFFGFMISCIATYHGFAVKGGAEGVGKGTNQAVVWGMVMVLIMDYFLTSFLVRIL